MRETKRMPTNSFTFLIDSQSWALRVFDAPSETTALPLLQSFIQVLCSPWNCLQMQLLPSAPSLPVSFVFGKPPFTLILFFELNDKSLSQFYYFLRLLSSWRECHWKEKKDSQTRGNAMDSASNVDFRKCFIRKTGLSLVSLVNRNTKAHSMFWFLG